MFKGVSIVIDLSLRYQFFWTNDASLHPIFSLKHLTQRDCNDLISADIAPSGGRNQLIKFETSNRINFDHLFDFLQKFYQSIANWYFVYFMINDSLKTNHLVTPKPFWIMKSRFFSYETGFRCQTNFISICLAIFNIV